MSKKMSQTQTRMEKTGTVKSKPHTTYPRMSAFRERKRFIIEKNGVNHLNNIPGSKPVKHPHKFLFD
jgi:hypothetical protein